MSKKINCLILFSLIVLIMCLTNVAFAKKPDTLHYNGEDHKYTGPEVTLVLNRDNFEVTDELMPPVILENRTLVPVREVFEKLGGTVNWVDSERKVEVELGSKKISLWIDSTEAKVDDKTIEIDVTAKVINNKTMVPARFISEQGGLIVGWEPSTNTVSIDSPKATITNVEYTTINNIKCIVVSANSTISGYKYFMLDEPYRLILDVENCEFNFDTSTRKIDDDLIDTIRFGDQGNDVNRVVLDLNKDTDYIVVPSKDKTKLYFAMAEEFTIPGESNGDAFLGQAKPDDENPNINAGNTNTGDELNTNSGDVNTSDEPNINSGDINSGDEPNINSGDNPNLNTDENNSDDDKPNGRVEVIPDVTITGIKYNPTSKRVRIIYDGDIEYSHMYLANPDRIVIDIENALLDVSGLNEINIKNSVITSIRYSQYEEDSVRIVLDLTEKVDYNINEKTRELQITVSQPTYKNVSYKLNNNNSQITLKNVKLNDLSETRDEDKNRYTIKFSTKDFDCGKGEITPEDNYVDKITISQTKIIIYDTGDKSYTIKQSGSDVIITIRNAEDIIQSNKQKIILLDAGHGGKDVGSVNGTSYEKNYNLAVLLKLKDLLEDEGYLVYTTRETDVTLTVDDRVTLATEDYPNADLYVSIHHNSIDNKNYTGTLVMYCPRDTSDYGITNKRFAQLVKEELVEHLGTVDRGYIVVGEGDTSKRVLTELKMPSILCELAFISNDEELARIKTEEFQEAAAEAIRDGINKALEEME